MRIGAKLMLGAAAGVLVVVSVVSLAAYRIARGSLEEQIVAHLTSVAQSRAAHVQTFLWEHKERIRLAATSRVLADGLRALETGDGDRASVVEDLNTRLGGFLTPDGRMYAVMLLDRHGEVVASTDPKEIGQDRSTDACFVGARDGPFIKDAYHSTTAGRASLALSAPLTEHVTGELLGVLVAPLDMADLNKITVDRTGLGRTGETYLINRYGFMITPSRFLDDTFLTFKVETENARECLAHREATSRELVAEGHEQHEAKLFADYRAAPVLGVHAYVPEMRWGLLAEIDAGEALAPIARLKAVMLLIAALVASGALVLSYRFSRRLSDPIHQLHTGSERIGAGELDYRLDIRTGDEIEQLAGEFNRMAARPSESYSSLEQKVADGTTELSAEVDERKRVEETLRQSENKYRMLLENLPQKIFLKDKNCVYVSCNQNYARDLKIRAEEIAGKTDHDFYPEQLAEKYRADDKRVMEIGEAGEIEETYIVDGRESIVHTVRTPVREATGSVTGLLGVLWDITERKRAEEQIMRHAERMQTLNAELERSNRDLEEFTYTICHDLQEPLRKIHTFGQFLMEDCAEDIPEEGRQHIRRMQDATLRMKQLIQHLLTLSRVGTHGGELVPVDPRRAIDRALETLSERARQCEAEVSVEDGLPMVTGDAVQLEQVFQNLIGNAMKFRSPDRAPRITIGARTENGQATFCLRDNGIGIDGCYLERIFGVFKRLHTRDEYEGAGVGLALCQKIIGRHGGRIWAESELGEGTTFYFTLPTPSGTKEQEP